MAPIRRYLRITKVSALEVRIYLDKPSDTPWLLSSRDPALPRIMKLIRPKILPKLREENENSKRKGGKKRKNIRDVASQDDFEVILFLTDTSTRHSLITKQKRFSNAPPIKSTGSKMTGWLDGSKEAAIDLSNDDNHTPELLREETEEDVDINTIPPAHDAVSVHSSDDEDRDDAFEPQHARGNIRRTADGETVVHQQGDDKKKLLLNTTYDSFSIYGKILCLIVKRRQTKPATANEAPRGSQMMEQWVSTQAAMEPDLDDNDT